MPRHRKNRNEPVAVPAQPNSFTKVNENAAGIDCGSDAHHVTVPLIDRFLTLPPCPSRHARLPPAHKIRYDFIANTVEFVLQKRSTRPRQ
jgi:hypothetical protein